MATKQEKVLPEFITEQATLLLFPERMVTDSFGIKFYDDHILVSISDKHDLHELVESYQKAYFRERINDAKWLESHVSGIVKMCTNGCRPFIDYFSRDKLIQPLENTGIPLTWLGQILCFRYCGNFGETFYYEVRVEDSSGGKHKSGNEVLLRMVLMQDDFAKYHLRHTFKYISYQTRLSVPIDEMEVKTLHVVKERVFPIASEVLSTLGGRTLPNWENKKNKNQRECLRILAHTEKELGFIEMIVALNYFESGGKLEIDLCLELQDNNFTQNCSKAIGQISGVEAMNLFLIRCKQLKRELGC